MKYINKYTLLPYGVILILAMLLYSNTINHNYVWDDALVITNNKYTQKGIKGLKDIFTKRVFLHNRNVYRPIPQLVYALTFELAPNNPKVAHSLNIMVYAVACLVAMWFLLLVFNKTNKWLLGFISLLFVLHPIHTEVVANIKSLDEILAFLFSLLSLIFWIKFLKRQNILFFILFSLFFFLALLSKISAITISPLFFILFFYKADLPLLKTKGLKLKDWFIKILFSNKHIKTKNLFKINIGLMFFLFYAFVFNNVFIAIGIVFILSFLFFKSETEILKLIHILSVFVIFILFRLEASLFLFYFVFITFYLKKNNLKSKYTMSVIILFIIGAMIMKGGFFTIIPGILLSMVLILFSLNKNKIAYLIMVLIFIVSTFVNDFYNPTNLSLALFAFYKLLNKQYKYTLIILFFVVFISDYYVFEKSSFSSSFYNKKQLNVNNLKPDFNTDISQSMSPLNNTLYNEENKEIKYATIAKIQLKYLQLLVFPHPLIHQYGFNQITKTTFKDWKVWFSIVVHLLLFLFALYKLKYKSPIAFGILFYLSTISIYTNIVVLMPDTLAERFLFTPSLGFLIAFVFFLDFIIKKLKIKKEILVLFIILLPVFLAFAYKTFDRNKAWENNLELARQTIKYAKNNAAINAQYASELYNHQLDSQQVFYYYNRALEIYPNFYSASKDLATFFITKDNPSKAEKYLLKCIALKPKDWESYYFLGFIEYEKKYYDKAVPYYENALNTGYDKMPKEKLIYASEFLARCYFNTHQIQKADDLLKNIYREHKAKSSIILLGNIYHQFGKTQKAIDTYIFLQKDFPEDKDLKNTIEILKKKLNN